MPRLFGLLLLVCAFAVQARGDGCVVPQRAVVQPVRTPDQKALLRFDGTTETLVIETTLQGEGREFAWLLPLPAAPKIEASTTGLFPTLDAMCSPIVNDGGKDPPDPTWILVAALGAGLWTTVRWWRRPIRPIAALLAAPVLVSVAGVTCGWGPTYLYLKGGDGPDSVGVLSREQVGVFDTATLEARDGAGLRAWLDANGFAAPEGIDRIADEYAKEGWVFVASRIRRDTDDAAPRRIHPLAFTFPSKRAVYPMRLTGAVNDSVALDLFVAGDRRAEADGMAVGFCNRYPSFARGEETAARDLQFDRFDDDASPMSDEFIRRCAGVDVLTHLTGVFDRAAMARDLDVRWTEFVPTQTVFLTDDEALRRSLLPGAWGLTAALLVAAALGRRRAVAAGVRATWLDAALIVAALAVAGGTTYVVWHRLPRLPGEARIVEGDGPNLERRLKDPPRAIRGDAGAVRAWVRSASEGCTNAWTGEAVREEDSPGNWSVRERDGLVELRLHHNLPWYGRAIDLSRLAVIEGTVRTADGKPVAGAWVRLTDVRWSPAPGEFFMYSVGVEADERGRFRLEVPVGRRWHLSVVHADHPYLLRKDEDLRDPPAAPMDLVLPRERSIRGRVVDGEGRPRGGLRVEVIRESPFTTHGTDGPFATTAADGTFEVAGFDAEAAELRVLMHLDDPDRPNVWDPVFVDPARQPFEWTLRER